MKLLRVHLKIFYLSFCNFIAFNPKPEAAFFGTLADLIVDPDLDDSSDTPLKKFGFGGLPYFLICHLTYSSRLLSCSAISSSLTWADAFIRATPSVHCLYFA